MADNKPMTKVEFANIALGTVVKNLHTHIHYRLYERGKKGVLILHRLSPVLGTACIEFVYVNDRTNYTVTDRF